MYTNEKSTFYNGITTRKQVENSKCENGQFFYPLFSAKRINHPPTKLHHCSYDGRDGHGAYRQVAIHPSYTVYHPLVVDVSCVLFWDHAR